MRMHGALHENLPLTQALYDIRTDQIGERQPLPQLDKQSIIRIKQIGFGYAFVFDQQVFITQ
jgi:hypothetical protein